MTTNIEFEWQSTPQLWLARREGLCGCEECMRRFPYGLGRTQDEAERDLREREQPDTPFREADK